MQHPKTRSGTIGTGTKLKTSGGIRDNSSSRSLTTRSPNGVDHRLQRAPTSEILQKKRVGKQPELEIQLARLQEELKKTKGQLNESESCTKRAYQEAEEAKRQLAAMSAKLDDTQLQLDELWASEESRIQELRKISQDRDRAWESELKAVQRHLSVALNENHKLNVRLQEMAESEAAQSSHAESAHDEVLTLRSELSETVNVVEELKNQLNESKDSESRALELVSQTREQLEMIKSEKAEAERVEQLGSALAANVELADELRRLKVQTEQWRKAAEVAASMVLGDGGKFVENSETFDIHVIGEKSSLLYSEDTEDESTNKKTSTVLRKLGVLFGQK
uniref:interactor of constitutive active ROPs 2, chloroplastic-like n=1 Tax=Erigeron canadensis TaxID=72917 RepID=UPI001CB8B6DF|nr:interactor of constitutive active ROPs 2, chloroplastic-like [Erigeron canadensis]